MAKKKAPAKKLTKKSVGKQLTYEDIFSTAAWKNMNPDLQDVVKLATLEFDVSELPNLKLTKKELVGIITKTAAKINPYYAQEQGDLFTSFTEQKTNYINATKTAIQRESEDLNRNLQNGRDDLAEGNRIAIRQLQISTQRNIEERDIHVNELRQDLALQITDAKTKLKQGLGDISEDEALALKRQERDFTQQYKQLQQQAASNGVTFSGETELDKKLSKENAAETMQMTKTQAERAQRDLSQGLESQVGTQNLQDVAGANLLGGVEGVNTTYTNRQIQQAMRGAGQNIEDSILQYEQQYGSEAASNLAGRYGIQLTGTLGAQNTAMQRYTAAQQQQTQRAASDQMQGFAEQFGTPAAQQVFGGQASALPSLVGSAQQSYTQGNRELKYNKARDINQAITTTKKGIIGSRML